MSAEEKDIQSQWKPLDWEFLLELTQKHNDSVFKKEDGFDDFVIANKEKINNPEYFHVLVEQNEMTNDYFKEHFEMCKICYDFIKANQDLYKLDLGLRTGIRIGMFEHEFEEYLSTVSG